MTSANVCSQALFLAFSPAATKEITRWNSPVKGLLLDDTRQRWESFERDRSTLSPEPKKVEVKSRNRWTGRCRSRQGSPTTPQQSPGGGKLWAKQVPRRVSQVFLTRQPQSTKHRPVKALLCIFLSSVRRHAADLSAASHRMDGLLMAPPEANTETLALAQTLEGTRHTSDQRINSWNKNSDDSVPLFVCAQPVCVCVCLRRLDAPVSKPPPRRPTQLPVNRIQNKSRCVTLWREEI